MKPFLGQEIRKPLFSHFFFSGPMGLLEKLTPKSSGLELTRKVCGGLQPINLVFKSDDVTNDKANILGKLFVY